MTEGISKERLKQILHSEANSRNKELQFYLGWLITTECKELDPWLPIDDRAKESKKSLLVKNDDDIDLCVWREDLQIWYPSYFEPTHYKEVKT